MKKFLLFAAVLLTSISTAFAVDRAQLTNYTQYATRIMNGNPQLEGNALFDEVIEALGAAQDALDGSGDIDATGTALITAVNNLLATATAENPIYLANYNPLSVPYSAETLQTDEGWTMTKYSGANTGGNTWYVESSGQYRGLVKWGGSADLNDASFAAYDLPEGVYTFTLSTLISNNRGQHIYYQINDGEIVAERILNENESAFEDHTLVINVTEAGSTLRVGCQDTDDWGEGFEANSSDSRWIALHIVQLSYTGSDALAPFKAQLVQAVSDASELLETLTQTDNSVPASALEALQAVIAQYDGATYGTQAAYEEATAAVKAAISETNAVQTAYANYLATQTQVLDNLDATGGDNPDQADALRAVLEAQDAIVAEADNAEAIINANTALMAANTEYQIAVATAENPAVIYNSGQITSTDGWLTGGVRSGSGSGNLWYSNSRSGVRYMEEWGSSQANYAYQVIDKLPAGLYTLSLNVGVTANTTYTIVFGDQEKSVTPDNSTINPATNDFYLIEETENVQFGVRLDAPTWCAFNELKLEYKGSDLIAAMYATLSNKIDEVLDVAAAYEDAQTLPEAAIAYISDFANELDGQKDDFVESDEFQTAIDQLNDLLASAAETAAAYAAYNEAAASAAALGEKYPDAAEALDDVVAETGEAVAQATTADEIAAQTALIEAALKEVGLSVATRENPYELYNSGQITSTDGWITGGLWESGSKANNLWFVGSNRTIVTGKDEDGNATSVTGICLEEWGSKSSNYAYRELTDLPAGGYEVSANIALTTGNQFQLYFNGDVETFDGVTEGGHYSALFVLPEDGNAQFGIVNPQPIWVAFRDLTLRYLGTDVVDIYQQKLQGAVNNANEIATLADGVGEGLFEIKESALDTYKSAIADAESKLSSTDTEVLGAAITGLDNAYTSYAADVNEPDPDTFYGLVHYNSYLYLNLSEAVDTTFVITETDPETGEIIAERDSIGQTSHVTLGEVIQPVKFVKTENGKWYIGFPRDQKWLGYHGRNSWTLFTTLDKRTEFDITRGDDGGTIFISTSKGYLGTWVDDVALYGEGTEVYGSESADIDSEWQIELIADQEAVAIQHVGENGQQADSNAIYNIAGQRLSAPQKGINIIGGRKVLVK